VIIAALRSGVTFVVVSLYVLVAGSIGMLLAALFRWPGVLYIIGHGGVRLGLLLSGIRYTVSGLEKVPPGRAVVFCSNHQSNIDPPVLFTALHSRLHILYKAEINKIPVLGRGFQMGGFVPVDRGDKDQALRGIDQAAQSLRDGHSFLIFPEGTRSRTDEMLPFKKGGFIMAIKAQVPIMPVAVDGGRDAMRKGSAIIWPVTVRVKVGEPIETAGLTVDQRDKAIKLVRASIQALLDS
jgi:1-acyl-sn-glycerol-3-phosphate acyltransferase